jgi:hypothetical protein
MTIPQGCEMPSLPPPPAWLRLYLPMSSSATKTNSSGSNITVASTTHRGSPTARLQRRPRHLHFAAVSPTSTTTWRATRSFLYSQDTEVTPKPEAPNPNSKLSSSSSVTRAPPLAYCPPSSSVRPFPPLPSFAAQR